MGGGAGAGESEMPLGSVGKERAWAVHGVTVWGGHPREEKEVPPAVCAILAFPEPSREFSRQQRSPEDRRVNLESWDPKGSDYVSKMKLSTHLAL